MIYKTCNNYGKNIYIYFTNAFLSKRIFRTKQKDKQNLTYIVPESFHLNELVSMIKSSLLLLSS